MHKPVRRELGKVLNEISGLAFHAEDSALMAISDSKDNIFQIQLRKEKLRDYAKNFYDQEDFEDLVIVDSTVYVLVSTGTLLAVPAGVQTDSLTEAYPDPFEGKNDFESLYYDPELRSLVLICKTCEHEKGRKLRTAYRFRLDSGTFDTAALYTISSADVEQKVRHNDAEFKPSAAAIHPIDKRLYILASAGQLLVITDRRGRVLEAYRLNPDMHPQAEGLAFAPNGTMYISNEGKYGKATLSVFPYQIRKNAQKQK
ncbi:MAG TPA: SdiA-regulated domain-containing protein [Chitinophagaceae bacterium]|jgi:uncharacterized protein YjiK|nr:SdiA-regulated domain-containing protein [Chitinophagaceae bacterium]